MSINQIVVVSGSYGAGHDAAADALADELRWAGHVVRRLDVAEELPWRIGALLRWVYFAQLRLVPRSWGTTLRCLERDGWALGAVRRLLGWLGHRLVHQVVDAGLVISTHPFASQALGQARAGSMLEVPVVTYLTDASVHRLWVHPAVDLHLAIHEIAAEQARALGGTTTVVRPVVARSAQRTHPGWAPPWPSDQPAALIVGGSCGVGALAETASDVLATGLMTPVVACGTNDRLRAHLTAVPGIVALGWRDDMTALVAAATCVLQNAGGMTCLESLAAGTPILTYRPIPGHGTKNAEVLDLAGLVTWVHDPRRLAVGLGRIMAEPGSSALPRDAASVLEVLSRQLLLEVDPLMVAA